MVVVVYLLAIPWHTKSTYNHLVPKYIANDSDSRYYSPTAIDDPHKIVKVIASDGKSGETREISYSNCKVIGNGSFGVVFQAKLVGAPKDGDDIAIKKVLQDKRFKVRSDHILPAILASDLVFMRAVPYWSWALICVDK
jgi:hypothetical protein